MSDTRVQSDRLVVEKCCFTKYKSRIVLSVLLVDASSLEISVLVDL